MRSRCFSFLICLMLLVALTIPANAANKVGTIAVQAVINEDGSMQITQVWEGLFEEGTENYIPMNAPAYLTIHDLQVSDQNGTYQTVQNWNVKWRFEEKAQKCGINYTADGYEICFGISQYGSNRYTIVYTLDNAVGSYTDKDGVNFRFVNDQMNTTPTDVTVEIRLSDGTPITDANTEIWAFGYKGVVEFENGSIIARTDRPITAQNHVTVMLALDKGLITPVRQEPESFETVRKQAFEGSDYDEPLTFADVMGTVFTMASLIALFVAFAHIKKKWVKKQMQAFINRFGYFRDIPNTGDANASYTLGKFFKICEEESILAYGIMRLIDLGCLSPISEQQVGFMGKTKESVTLQLKGCSHSRMNEFDEYLYTVLEAAAGADGILQEKELERFAGQNDKLLRNYIAKCDSSGRQYLSQKKCLKRWDIPAKLSYLTPAGEQELGELLGFKKYLEDFSLIAERSVKELPIWRELLSYAMLFGIADKVAEQLKALYPDISTEVATYSQGMHTAYSYQYLLYRNMLAAEQRREQQKRSRGGGGFASFGGGGGSIGGGSRGGSR